MRKKYKAGGEFTEKGMCFDGVDDTLRIKTSWRPEGWENPQKKIIHEIAESLIECSSKQRQDQLRLHLCESFAFEAGADAMLEALRKKPYKVIEWNCPVCGSERLVCDNCLVNRKFSAIPGSVSI